MTTEPAFGPAAKADGATPPVKVTAAKRPQPQPVADDIETSRTFLRDDGWHDQLEGQVRGGVRMLIEALIEAELAEALGRTRYKRSGSKTPAAVAPAASEGLGDDEPAATSAPATGHPTGHRNGRRCRTVMGTFGKIEIAVLRARIDTDEPGKTPSGRPRFCSAISGARKKSMH